MASVLWSPFLSLLLFGPQCKYLVRIPASPYDLHTRMHMCICAKQKMHTHTQEEFENTTKHTSLHKQRHTHTHKRRPASEPGFCVAPHANEAKRSEMNPLSQRWARGVLQAESSVRERAWQANAPSVDSFHWTSNGKRWGPTTTFFHAIGFPVHRI